MVKGNVRVDILELLWIGDRGQNLRQLIRRLDPIDRSRLPCAGRSVFASQGR